MEPQGSQRFRKERKEFSIEEVRKWESEKVGSRKNEDGSQKWRLG
jgi:hypothetical protein